MSIPDQISSYISSQTEAKRNDMLELHGIIQDLKHGAQLWFLDGKNSEDKVVRRGFGG